MLKKPFLPLLLVLALLLLLASCESFSDDERVWISDSKDHLSEGNDDTDTDIRGDMTEESEITDPVINTSSKRIHLFPDCSHVSSIKEENQKRIDPSEIDAYLDQGYEICKSCSKRDTKTSE